MTALRRSLPLVAALVLLALAGVLALLAVDIHSWQRTVARDDVRFAALHSRPDLWRSPAALPGDPARVLLGMDDGLAFRRSLQLFWLSEIAAARSSSGSLTQVRVDTQESLQQLADHAGAEAERSVAANLLGVMTVTTPAADNATQTQTLQRAADYFREAIAEDPSNYPARVNLELLLRLTKPDKSRFGKDAKGGYGAGGARGSGVIGGGY